MFGAACGLFVGIQVGSAIPALTTVGFVTTVTIAGAVGAYLGIDTPPHRFRGIRMPALGQRQAIDATEMLTAAGTFLAALAALAAVGLVVLGIDVDFGWNVAILAGWTAGVFMQIAAGSIARVRA